MFISNFKMALLQLPAVTKAFAVGLSLLCFVAVMPVMAEQIQVTGTATIVNGQVDKAREAAISQALNYASLKAGVNFSSELQTRQGKLTKETFQMHRMGAANDIQLISETISGKQIAVTLQLDLVEQDMSQQCSSHSLKAAIMLPKSYIKQRKELSYGQLHNLEADFSDKLGQELNDLSRHSFARVFANERLDSNNPIMNYRGNLLPSWVSEITDSHYVLQPEILDISTAKHEKHLFGLINHYPLRQIRFKLSLFHGISGEQVWTNTYSSSAPWEFEKNQAVETSSSEFWDAVYGKKLLELFEQSVIDLDNQLNCRPLLGQIIARQGERIIINMGRNSGISMGDKFQIVLQHNIPDRLNMMRAVASKSRATVQIDQVTENTATALITGLEMADNIQINDIAIKI